MRVLNWTVEEFEEMFNLENCEMFILELKDSSKNLKNTISEDEKRVQEHRKFTEQKRGKIPLLLLILLLGKFL